MCIQIYLGSDRALPELPHDAARPGFHTRPVTDPHVLEALRRLGFSARCVVAAGSFMGCGCGFAYGSWSRVNPDEDHPLRVRDVRDLYAFLAANRAGRQLVVFSADYDAPPAGTRQETLNPEAVPPGDGEFELPVNTLLVVAAGVG